MNIYFQAKISKRKTENKTDFNLLFLQQSYPAAQNALTAFIKITKKLGMTETSYHTISIYEKLLVIQFHTYRKLYEISMINIFP